jgi:hypothetical protein
MRKQMNMRVLYNLLWTGLMIGSISSCVSEFPSGGGEKPPVEEAKGVLYVPMTRSDLAEENAIDTVRMIVFKANGEFVLNTTHPETTTPTPTFVDSVPTGYLNVYLIVNERPGWTATLDAITSEAELKAIRYEYSTDSYYLTHLPEADEHAYKRQIPMFGEKKNVYVSITGEPNPYEIEVQRIFAKVTLRLECLFPDSIQHSGGVALALDTVRLWRIPPHSWLIKERYTGASFWFNDLSNPSFLPFRPNPASPPEGWPVPLSSYKEIPESPGYAARFLDSICFYLPEYIPNDTALYTYLSIKVGIKAQPHIAKTYKLILGEGLKHGSKFMRGDSTLSGGHQRDVLDLSIQRNTHYDITANIRNFGLTGNEDMDVYLKVEQWTPVPMDTTLIIDYWLNISQSDFEITVGQTAVVMIETDHWDGWSATVDGDLVLNGSDTSLSRQDNGPLRFKANSQTAPNQYYYINVKVGKITKRIRITAT